MTTAELAGLDAARAEARAARAQWAALDEREHRLRQGWLTDENGTEHRVQRATERIVAQTRIDEEKARIAHRLEAAEARLHAARVEAANERLPALVESHAEAALVADRALDRLNDAWASLVAAAWLHAEARATEERGSARIVEAAKDGVRDPDERENLKHRAHHELPVRLGLDGVAEVVARSAPGMFGGSGEAADPGNPAAWRTLGQIVRLGRRRGRAALGAVLRGAVDDALARLEADKR
jgi:hypothetical protein